VELTIEDADLISLPADGFGRAPLEEGDLITMEIVNVPPSGAGTPGQDLTVVLRR
jgi:hypothetical protein